MESSSHQCLQTHKAPKTSPAGLTVQTANPTCSIPLGWVGYQRCWFLSPGVSRRLTWLTLVADCPGGVVDSLRGNKALGSTLSLCSELNCRLIGLERRSSSDSSAGLSSLPICSSWAIYNAPICPVQYHIRQNHWRLHRFNRCSHPRSINTLHIFQTRGPYGLQVDRDPLLLGTGRMLSFCQILLLIGIEP